MVGVKEKEIEGDRTFRIGEGEEAGGTGREIAWKRDSTGGTRERKTEMGERDDRTRGTDVFETSCRSSYA